MPEWVTKYWLEWLFGAAIAILTALWRSVASKIKQQQVENDALRNGMRSLLRSQIEGDCERALRDGYCGIRLRDSINDLYSSYHALGGNGTVTAIVDQVMKLPAVHAGE